MSPRRAKPPLTLDIAPLLETEWTGIPVFVSRLARALLASDEIDLSFALDLAPIDEASVKETLRIGSGAYLKAEFEAALAEGEAPRLIEPDRPVLYGANKGRLSGLLPREASTVHDLTTLFMPDTHDEGNVAYHLDHLSLELATDEAIFCISEATKATLIAAAPSSADRIRLMPQYVDWPAMFELTEANFQLAPPRPYALVIGTIEPRKNLALLMNALATPQLQRDSLAFVVLGKKGWLVDQFLAELAPPTRERVAFTGFVSEFVKYRLLRQAQFLIFPSLCEGFGIPALEAMSLGKPVLAARSSSLPEVVGDAGVYFDPLSVSEFIAALAEISADKKLAELAPRALERARAFTPERMAAPVIDWLKG